MTNQANNGKMKGLGRCHVCSEAKAIKYCPFCKHWICEDCGLSPDRVRAAFQEFVHGPRPGCCGPLEII